MYAKIVCKKFDYKRRNLFTLLFPDRLLVSIIAVGLAVRFLYFLTINKIIFVSDSGTYIDCAMSLRYALRLNIYRPPVYPLGILFGSLVFGWDRFYILLIPVQIIISALNIILAYKITLMLSQNRALSVLTSLLVSVSISMYGWDFMVMTETLSILWVTLLTYLLLKYFTTNSTSYIKYISIIMFAAVFTKPFFLGLPLAVLFIFLLKQALAGKNRNNAITGHCRYPLIRVIAGCLAIYSSIVIYSYVNRAQNGYFGISAVSSINSFGKVLQYRMQDLGSNKKLQEDIEAAYATEKKDTLVNGYFLEPFGFMGKYNWTMDNYNVIGELAKEAALKDPVSYIKNSVSLTVWLFLKQNPFRDFIALKAMVNKNTAFQNIAFNSINNINRITAIVDSLYLLMAAAFLEVLALVLFSGNRININVFLIMPILLIIGYTYAMSAFFSYGDYCRLVSPAYTLMYIIICIYLYRILLPAKTLFARIKSKAYHRVK